MRYPILWRAIEILNGVDELLGRSVQVLMQNTSDDHKTFGNEICELICALANQEDNAECRLENAVLSYVRTCHEHFKFQSYLVRKGRYHLSNISGIHDDLYGNMEAMFSYLDGLLLTQVFWPNHYWLAQMFRQFLDRLSFGAKYLEIGVGHGLFFSEVVRQRPDLVVLGVDVSHTALDYTRMVFELRCPSIRCPDLIQADIRSGLSNPHTTFNAISVAEVIEHVPDPEIILRKVGDLLEPNGKVYMTTAINAAAVDHIYLFETPEEVRALVDKEGFTVLKESVLPTQDLSSDKLRQMRVPINYGCIMAYKG